MALTRYLYHKLTIDRDVIEKGQFFKELQLLALQTGVADNIVASSAVQQLKLGEKYISKTVCFVVLSYFCL